MKAKKTGDQGEMWSLQPVIFTSCRTALKGVNSRRIETISIKISLAISFHLCYILSRVGRDDRDRSKTYNLHGETMIFTTIRPKRTSGRWARPQATMNALGDIKLSRVAFELLGEPTHVTVLFDKASQTIALKRADKHDTEGHELIAHGAHGRHGGRLIRVRGLLEHVETDLYTCMRFTDLRLDNHNRLILDLAKARPAYNGTRIGVYNE